MNSVVARAMRRAAVRQTAFPQPAAALAVRIPVCAARLAAGRRPASSLPTITQPSFWKSLVPKPLRRSSDGGPSPRRPGDKGKEVTSKEWNPATFYIVIFLCIGSMAIQMISLRKNFDMYMRQSEAKIGLLREVVERIQKGEDVDVEHILGTDDPEKEAEWEAVLKELERDETSRVARRQGSRQTYEAAAGAVPTPVSAPPAAAASANPPTSSPTVKIASTTSFY